MAVEREPATPPVPGADPVPLGVPATEPAAAEQAAAERDVGLYVASQWRLVWWRFRRHKLAMAGLVCLSLIALTAVFAEFLAPTTKVANNADYTYAPPQRIHLVSHEGGGRSFGPYVYPYKMTRDPDTYEETFTVDRSRRIPLGFFVHGARYELWGLFETDIHLFGPKRSGAAFYPLGANAQGQDVLSRVIYGTRISMSIGLVGVIVSLLLGILFGGIAGYYGRAPDTIIQRAIEFLISIPTIPLWMGLAAAVPSDWSPLRSYFAITIILSLLGWTQLALVVRARFLSMRQEDFVTAAILDGASQPRIMWRHMLPSIMSHVIAATTLAVPTMILAETTLSFLGLGLQAPVVSWGVLLQEAQNLRAIATASWIVIVPGVAVVLAVLSLNFVGDGLRDAADPYGRG